MNKIENFILKVYGKYEKLIVSVFKFAASSGVSLIIDYTIFWLLTETLPLENRELLLASATFGARALSSLFNFFINKSVVFKDKNDPRRAMFRYYILCVVQAFNSFWMLALVSNVLKIEEGVLLICCKFAIECVLFCINYLVQRVWVFK